MQVVKGLGLRVSFCHTPLTPIMLTKQFYQKRSARERERAKGHRLNVVRTNVYCSLPQIIREVFVRMSKLPDSPFCELVVLYALSISVAYGAPSQVEASSLLSMARVTWTEWRICGITYQVAISSYAVAGTQTSLSIEKLVRPLRYSMSIFGRFPVPLRHYVGACRHGSPLHHADNVVRSSSLIRVHPFRPHNSVYPIREPYPERCKRLGSRAQLRSV